MGKCMFDMHIRFTYITKNKIIIQEAIFMSNFVTFFDSIMEMLYFKKTY